MLNDQHEWRAHVVFKRVSNGVSKSEPSSRHCERRACIRLGPVTWRFGEPEVDALDIGRMIGLLSVVYFSLYTLDESVVIVPLLARNSRLFERDVVAVFDDFVDDVAHDDDVSVMCDAFHTVPQAVDGGVQEESFWVAWNDRARDDDAQGAVTGARRHKTAHPCLLPLLGEKEIRNACPLS